MRERINLSEGGVVNAHALTGGPGCRKCRDPGKRCREYPPTGRGQVREREEAPDSTRAVTRSST